MNQTSTPHDNCNENLKGTSAKHRVVVICMDCGRHKTSDHQALTASEEVAQKIEQATDELVRVIRTNCLDYCPKGRVTIGIPTNTEACVSETRYVFLDPTASIEPFIQLLRQI